MREASIKGGSVRRALLWPAGILPPPGESARVVGEATRPAAAPWYTGIFSEFTGSDAGPWDMKPRAMPAIGGKPSFARTWFVPNCSRDVAA